MKLNQSKDIGWGDAGCARVKGESVEGRGVKINKERNKQTYHFCKQHICGMQQILLKIFTHF